MSKIKADYGYMDICCVFCLNGERTTRDLRCPNVLKYQSAQVKQSYSRFEEVTQNDLLVSLSERDSDH